MVASTALAQRRHENLEVEEFLAFHEHRVEAHQGITMQHAVQRTG
jgi:hypothetical protein